VSRADDDAERSDAEERRAIAFADDEVAGSVGFRAGVKEWRP
jgi:hypothetical protein